MKPTAKLQPPPQRRWLGSVAAGLLVLAGGAGYRTMAAFIGDEMAAPIQLDPPLRSLPMVIGDWQGKEIPLAESTLRIAGNDDYVNRTYRNQATGEAVGLYIAYTARPRTMLRHQPSVCYPSGGWIPTGVEDLQLSLADGRLLPVRLQRFYRPGLVEQRVVVLNYYVLNGVATIDENSFWGLGWRTPNLSRDASRYVAQVQVAVTERLDGLAARAAQAFATEVAPAAAKLLPGTAPATAPTGRTTPSP